MHVHPRLRSSLPAGAILAAAGLLAAAPVLAQDPAGIPVTDPTTGVTVTMPIEPQVQEATIPGTDIVIRYYLAVDGETATSFSVFEVTEADGGYDLDGGVNGSAEGTGGSVTASTPIVHQGHEGRDFELAVNDPATGAAGIVLSRLLWTGQNVVQLQAVGRDTDRARIEELFAGLVGSLDLGAQALASPGAVGAPGASPQASVAPGG
ncbi:MAG: hypothetical protein ABWZ82_07655 [Candidatus Limnocylindrales bacterium]